MAARDDLENRRSHKTPYSTKHPIPTIQKYHQEKQERQANAGPVADHSSETEEGEQKDQDTANRYLYSREQSDVDSDNHDHDKQSAHQDRDRTQKFKKKLGGGGGGGADEPSDLAQDTSEAPVQDKNPKQRRKALGKRKGERAYREVTDPVTHLPVRIHDLQPGDLKRVPENLAPPGAESRTATGLGNKVKSDEMLEDETQEIGRQHLALENLFPPPDFDDLRNRLNKIQKLGITVGVMAVGVAIAIYKFIGLFMFTRNDAEPGISWSFLWPYFGSTFAMILAAALAVAVIIWVQKWTDKQIHRLWEEEIWHADKHTPKSRENKEETTQWLNNILTALWPLVNPDLFVSLADTVEDVMQASLPSIVRMVSIEDIGQGSESMRILGVRCLPTGAAARSVGADGKLSPKPHEEHNDRDVPGGWQVDGSASSKQSHDNEQGSGKTAEEKEADEKQIAEGMEAEEGDFINIEVAFAYRTRSTSKKFRDRAKHAHLYISFYLPGNIKIPIYVDLRGFVGIMRCRLQLTPDPVGVIGLMN